MEAGPDTLEHVIRQADPGTTIELRPGTYGRLRVSGVRNDPARPIVVDGGGTATFSCGTSLEAFKPRAAQVARETKRSGRYPGIYPIAHEAALTIEHCAGLEFRNILFRNAWPTAIYVDDCHDLAFDWLDGLGSTYFIYAVGAATRNLRITYCHWLQDQRLWREVLWRDVHENSNPTIDGNYTGDRAFDGTFFCGVRIAGDIEIANCHIEHAFNGVHLFNQNRDPSLARNVHVHRCCFEFIKDNPIEPEDCAVNWWVHDNQFFNAHKWFSMELARAGWIYIYRNRGWFTEKPGPWNEKNNGGAVFKFSRTADEVGEYPGPIHVFNNSWYLRSPIAKEGAVRRLRHHNNAIVYCDQVRHEPRDACDRAGVFDDVSEPERPPFSKDWGALDIAFINDRVVHRNWPKRLVDAGYAIDRGMNENPNFVWDDLNRFALPAGANPCRGSGIPIPVLLPDGSSWVPRKPFNIGWYQDDPGIFDGLVYQRLPATAG